MANLVVIILLGILCNKIFGGTCDNPYINFTSLYGITIICNFGEGIDQSMVMTHCIDEVTCICTSCPYAGKMAESFISLIDSSGNITDCHPMAYSTDAPGHTYNWFFNGRIGTQVEYATNQECGNGYVRGMNVIYLCIEVQCDIYRL